MLSGWILVLTGYPDESNIKRILEYGADCWMRKPLDIGDLREEVAGLLGLSRPTRDTAAAT